jgi:hypothetical protein
MRAKSASLDAANGGRIPARLPALVLLNREAAREVAVAKSKAAVAGDDEFDPRVPLAWERLLVQRDYDLLSSLKGRPEVLRTGLVKLENIIHEEGASSVLEALCSLRCDRGDLLWLLHPFSTEVIFKDSAWSNKPGIGSLKALFGISPKKLQKLIKKLNELATQIEPLNEQSEFADLLATRPLHAARRLPRTLRTYARLLGYGAKYLAANSDIFYNIAKARLTSYVESRSHRGDVDTTSRRHRYDNLYFHDEEIARLISAALRDMNLCYDANAHRVWRRKHYRRLYLIDAKLESYGPLEDSGVTLDANHL